MDKDELYQKMLVKVIAFLGYKPRTRKEISVRLGKYLKSLKDVDDETKSDTAHRIFEYLDQNKLIDDEEFIKLFIESKTKGKSMRGKQVIQNRLMAKGISKEDATYYIDSTISEEDEFNNALKALIARFKVVTYGGPHPSSALEPEKYDTKETRDRMGRYLISRGFSYSTARQTVDYLLKRP